MNRNFKEDPYTLDEMISDISDVCDKNQIEPYNISFDTYIKLGGKVTGKGSWIRRGGFATIRNANFPNPTKDLKNIHNLKTKISYVGKLERNLGSKLNIEDLVKEVISSLKVKVQPSKKVKLVKNLEKVHVVAMLNDLHYGLRVDPEENDNLNSYDFREAGRRTAMFVKEIAEYKLHKRKQVEKLNLILNGDIIEGILRGGLGNEQHLLTHQVNGAVHILTHAIQHLSQEYPQIDIHCIAGNHDRMVHKDQGKRPTSEVWDSYANIIYYALSSVFKANKSIKFNMPKTPYGFINLPAGRLMYLHGDGIWNRQLGNPGKSINVGNVGSAIREFNAGEVAKGNDPIKMVLVGHSHSYCSFTTSDGVEVCVAPSLCGINGFAHMLNINNNLIGQIVFESTPEFIFGDSRLVRVNSADKNSDFDKIIPEYKRELQA